MKTIAVILTFISLLLSARPSFAQHQVGIIGGVSMAKVKMEGLDIDYGYNTGFGVGGVLDIYLSDYASLYFQPRYIQKGVNIDETIPFLGDVNGQATISYLEIPVSLKIAYTEDTIQPYIFVGPSFGFLLGSKFEGVANDLSINGDVSEVTGGFDIGLGAGSGVGFVVGSTSIFVEGRYIIGYTDILNDGTIVVNGQEAAVSGDIENRNFELMAGIKVQLGD